MLGKYKFTVHNESDKKVSYTVEIKRSITIIRGDSGIGKTYFVNMLATGLSNAPSGVKIQSNFDKNKLEVIKDRTRLGEVIKLGYKEKIFVIDENVNIAKDKQFISYLKSSGSYLIYVTRKNLVGILPFSVNEVYSFESKSSGNDTFTTMIHRFQDIATDIIPDVIVTEDSNSGHDIIEHIVNVPVITSNGKDKVAEIVRQQKQIGNKKVYVIVDGACFGNCMEKVVEEGAYVAIPESFEYLIVNTYIFNKYINDELTKTYKYAESRDFFTWEQYYTYLLQNLCDKFPNCSYNKEPWDKLNNMFKVDKFLAEISNQLSDLSNSVKTI